jgi:hypothetical protein
VIDGVDDRPSPLARVGHEPADALQVVALGLEGALGQLAQPRAHDRAAVPQPRDLLEVDVERRRVHELEALRIGLHQPVLHPVVDHLHEVPGAGRPEVAPAVRRGQHVEDRGQAVDTLLRPAHHHAVADLEPPHAAGHADVDVVQPAAGQRLAAAHVVVPVGVAAVDDQVARVEQHCQ